jgi:hypothetical protein
MAERAPSTPSALLHTHIYAKSDLKEFGPGLGPIYRALLYSKRFPHSMTFDPREIKDEKIAALYSAAISGNITAFLELDLQKLIASTELMKTASVGGKQLPSWPEYATHLPVFMNLYAQTINEEKLLATINLDKQTATVKYVTQAKEGKFSPVELVSDLIQQGTQTGTERMNSLLYYQKEDIERLKKTVDIHDTVNNDLNNQRNKVVRRYLLLNLGRDAFEVYLLVLKELYTKIKGEPKQNKEIYEFFRNYPPLYDEDYHELRNDVAHSLFDVRDKFSDDDLHRLSNLLLVKTFIGLVAKHHFLIDFHRKGIDTMKTALANPALYQPKGAV